MSKPNSRFLIFCATVTTFFGVSINGGSLAQNTQFDAEGFQQLLVGGDNDSETFLLGLMEEDCPRSDQADSVIVLAAKSDAGLVVQEKSERGINIDAIGPSGQTSQTDALTGKVKEAIPKLLDRGAYPGKHGVGGQQTVEIAGAIALQSMLNRYPAQNMDQAVIPPGTADDVPEDISRERIFHGALLSGEIGLLHELLDEGVDLDAPPDDARPFLHTAVIVENAEAVRLLLKAGADESASYQGLTAAELAESLSAWELAALLGQESAGAAELMEAIEDNDPDQVARVLARGVDPDVTEAGGTTALIRALMMGNPALVDVLMDGGADPNLATRDGTLPLTVPVLTGDTDLIEALVRAGADPDGEIDGVPLLSMAVFAGDASVHALLDAGADAEVSDADGLTPADLAATLGKTALVRPLGGSKLSDGAEQKPDLEQAIAMHDWFAIRAALERESPNQTTAQGVPYLHALAATTPDARTFSGLTRDTRLDLLATDRSGRDVIDAILANPDAWIHFDLLKALAGSKFDSPQKKRKRLQSVLLHRDGDGRSGLNRLIIAMSYELMQAFDLDTSVLGPIINKEDGTGVTPLEAAVISDRHSLITQFLQAGASPTGHDPSLQEIARVSGNWLALDALPYDRNPPPDFKKGASRSVRMEMQRRLRDWGYYTGKIDGILGRGSQAALKEYYSDVYNEILEIRKAKGQSVTARGGDHSPGDRLLSVRYDGGDWCTWKITKWYVDGSRSGNWSEQFIGCVEGWPKWNSNGSGLVEYSRGSDRLQLFGEKGWDGKETLD